jgi:hypothetical protein
MISLDNLDDSLSLSIRGYLIIHVYHVYIYPLVISVSKLLISITVDCFVIISISPINRVYLTSVFNVIFEVINDHYRNPIIISSIDKY